jgi:hypothetical protein
MRIKRGEGVEHWRERKRGWRDGERGGGTPIISSVIYHYISVCIWMSK